MGETFISNIKPLVIWEGATRYLELSSSETGNLCQHLCISSCLQVPTLFESLSFMSFSKEQQCKKRSQINLFLPNLLFGYGVPSQP